MEPRITIKARYVVYVIITIGILASVNYVIAQTGKSNPGHDISEISGLVIPTYGDSFTHWGSQTCPANTELLYSGYVFHSLNSNRGGSDPLCLKPDDPGPAASSTNNDRIYPMGTSSESYGLPPGISALKKVKCSVCYAPKPVADVWGTSACPIGWTAAYTGYSMGTYHSQTGQSGRHCIDNINFDSSNPHVDAIGGEFFATTLYGNQGTPGSYLLNRFIKCAVCVKNV